MHRSINIYLILLLLVTLAGAQQPTAAPHAAAKATTSANIPSEETVNAFLHEWFGYDPSLTWKVVSIKPSEIEGLSEVNAVLSGTQGTASAQTVRDSGWQACRKRRNYAVRRSSLRS